MPLVGKNLQAIKNVKLVFATDSTEGSEISTSFTVWKIAREMRQAREEHRRTGKPARAFAELRYRTRNSWSRRVGVPAEAIEVLRSELNSLVAGTPVN